MIASMTPEQMQAKLEETQALMAQQMQMPTMSGEVDVSGGVDNSAAMVLEEEAASTKKKKKKKKDKQADAVEYDAAASIDLLDCQTEQPVVQDATDAAMDLLDGPAPAAVHMEMPASNGMMTQEQMQAMIASMTPEQMQAKLEETRALMAQQMQMPTMSGEVDVSGGVDNSAAMVLEEEAASTKKKKKKKKDKQADAVEYDAAASIDLLDCQTEQPVVQDATDAAM